MNDPMDLLTPLPELDNLKNFLIGKVNREIENLGIQGGDRAMVTSTLDKVYELAKIQLPEPIRAKLFTELLNDLLGFGILQPLLDDDDVTEIMVNGASNIFIEKKGKILQTELHFINDSQVIELIEKIITPLGRRIDTESPTVDARLPDGSRVNAVIPPVAIDGPTITIRKFLKGRLTIDELINLETLTSNMANFLRACVISKLNIVISGGTGSGKTTLLNVLSGFIPKDERIITIEDAAELQLQQKHIVRMETKPSSIDGKNAVVIRDLVRNSLRMRPDRIVVGEVRGEEALDMLQAMNTGHEGALTTLHANSPRDAISRLETMCMMAGMDLPLKVVREQIASAVDVIIQISRLKDGSRKITSISEVAGMEGDTVVMTEIFRFEQTGILVDGKVIGELKPTGIRPLFTPRLESSGFRLGPEIFGANLSDMFNGRRR